MGDSGRKLVLLVALLLTQVASTHAYQIKQSGRSKTVDSPFVAYGYNPRTRIIAGYLAALRTSPGRTDECKLAFSGNPREKEGFLVTYAGRDAPSVKSKRNKSRAFLVVEQNAPYLKFPKKSLEGECKWILPFVVESKESEDSDEVTVEMPVQHSGNWIAVNVIDAQKAKFHSRPDASAVQKPYLVRGDVIYIYDENSDWYFVKYEERKRKTEGWIRKADTLQP